MATKYNRLPPEVKQECLCIVRGYDRRAELYRKRCQEAILSARIEGTDDAHSRIERLERSPEMQKMLAVKQSKSLIGAELPEEIRHRLAESIMLNCINGRDYPFERLNLPEFSRRDFYRRRDRFLYDIACYLSML